MPIKIEILAENAEELTFAVHELTMVMNLPYYNYPTKGKNEGAAKGPYPELTKEDEPNKKTDPEPKPTKEEESNKNTDPEPTTDQEEITLGDLKKAMSAALKEGKRQAAKDLIAEFGVLGLGKLPEEKYAEFLERLRGI